MKLTMLGLGLCLMLTSCRPHPGFSRAELTMEEIVSLYEVPLEKKPAYKFIWNFNTASYLQFVVEEAKSKDGPWAVLQTIPYHLPLSTANVIFQIENTSLSAPDGNYWIVAIRLGGSNGISNGWSGSRILVPAASIEYTAILSQMDPAELYTVNFKGQSIRFRLESSDKPFQK
jgi:hypothetical protein